MNFISSDAVSQSSLWRWSPIVVVTVLILVTGRARAADPETPLQRRLNEVKFEHYAQGPGYSEGPTWHRGEVFFCSNGLQRVTKDRQTLPCLDIGPAGTVVRPDGGLLICDNRFRALVELTPDGALNVLAEQFGSSPLRSLNDLTVDARGNIYWTDPEGSSRQTPVGNVFRLRPDGRVDRIATGLAFPNGLDVDPASRFLYVIESQSQKILRYALPADEDLCGQPEVFANLGGSGGDGCAFDTDGNLWVADFHRPETGYGRITVYSSEAQVLGYLPIPAKVVSNITFGGPEKDEIFCTTGDPPGVFRARVGVKGFQGHPARTYPIVRTLNVVVRRPHSDAEALQAWVVRAAALRLVEGRWEDGGRRDLQELADEFTERETRAAARALLPELERAAARAQRDQALLAEIRRLNGKAVQEVFAPDWLRAAVGDGALNIFARITEIYWNERTDGHKEPESRPLSQRVHDESLKLLAGQDRLRRLELSGTAVTSAGLVHLRDLTTLQYLNLCLTAVSDEGFEHLAGLTQMRRMTVCSSKVTGAGFSHLGGMTRLESINLHSSPASDAGLAAIAKLTSLRRLEIVHTDVTDTGLGQLAALKNLRQIHIHGRQTSADALPFLNQLQQLVELDVYEQPASNATLERIAGLPQLRMLRLYNGSFDDAGVRALGQIPTLEDVVLQSPHVTDAAVDVLGRLPRLRTVSLRGTAITAAGRQRLQTMRPAVVILD